MIDITETEKERVIDMVRRSVHSRARSMRGQTGYITFYGHESASPSGVMRIGSCPLTDDYIAIIRGVSSSICPLSPTER